MSAIKLTGSVRHLTDDGQEEALENATVKALRLDPGADHTIAVQTNSNGLFELALEAGHWRITTWKTGYGLALPGNYEERFTQDVADLNFVLRPTVDVRGTVVALDNERRLRDVIVTARMGNRIEHRTTNNDGDFTFYDLMPGEWSFTAMAAGYLPDYHPPRVKGEAQTVSLAAGADAPYLNLKMARISGQNDTFIGRIFFGVLIAAFIALAFFYLSQHRQVKPTAEPISSAIVTLIDTAETALSAASDPATATDDAPLADNQLLVSTIAAIGDSWQTISPTVADTDRQVITTLLADVDNTVAANDAEAVASALARLNAVITTPPADGYFWNQEPWSFFEVLYWALFGVLANLIGTIGFYLRRGTFYPQGIDMHLSQIITVPAMALVVSWLLRVASLSFELAGNAVTLDLSDPRILAAFAFLLGFQPWNLRDWLTGTAARVLGRA